MSYVRDRVRAAVVHDQIYFAFDEYGNPVAFWIWAFLAPDVGRRLMTDPYTALHDSEWDEGGNLWILDIVAPFGHANDVIRFIAREFFPGYDKAVSVRRLRGGRIRTSVWKRPSARGLRESSSAVTPRLRLPRSAFAASRTEWTRQVMELGPGPGNGPVEGRSLFL